ncbi:MAG: type II toxin-antitoxin system VapC family toxin [Candidatus Korarchaeota archaeon]|nr:type II toxin-antitoxin system VapC family toxin [Candidatus Korarchaeota archaeon]
MTLMENDVIFAYMNESDENHQAAVKIFQKLREGKLRVDISGITLLEMELIYRSQRRESELLKVMSALLSLPNVGFIPLTPEIVITSIRLREKIGLSFFDSHYAATALYLDGRIISFDEAYDKVPGLVRMDPRSD